jgi:hypothetical protein
MVHQGLLSCSQQNVVGSSSEPDEFSPHIYHLFIYQYLNIRAYVP